MKDKRRLLMPDLLLRSFAPFLLACQPCFTQPSFDSFWALTCAWILCSGRRSLTRIIQAAQLTDFKHFSSFHRFFSQARWNLDDLGRCVFQLLLPFCEEVLVVAVDDTLARKSGRHIWGAGMHHDPLRSTQKRPCFSFGHNFVVLSLQVALPFAPDKYWAFPILVRMYRKRQTNQRAPGKSGKLERKHNAKLISRMNMKAALYEPVGKAAKRGRRRKKGDRLPSPLQMAQNKKAKWIKTTLTLYGKQVKLWYQTIDALWYPSAGQQLLRIVVVHDPSGRRRDDCFFSLDLTLSATQILEIFSRRWPLEVCFRDVKQFLGFEDPQNRVAKATTRTAPLIFFIYDLALLWYAQSGHKLAAKSVLERLWYPQKNSVSFEDILRTLRHATWQERIFSDPALDAHTRKILQPFVEWAKTLT